MAHDDNTPAAGSELGDGRSWSVRRTLVVALVGILLLACAWVGLRKTVFAPEYPSLPSVTESVRGSTGPLPRKTRFVPFYSLTGKKYTEVAQLLANDAVAGGALPLIRIPIPQESAPQGSDESLIVTAACAKNSSGPIQVYVGVSRSLSQVDIDRLKATPTVFAGDLEKATGCLVPSDDNKVDIPAGVNVYE